MLKFEYDDRDVYISENKQLELYPGYFDSLSTRDKVNLFERLMKEEKQRDDLKVQNYFSKDVYARELFIPKDTILTGHIHKYENLNIMTKGDMSVLVGEEVKRVKAPFVVVSPPGTKRIAYAHEDTIWITIHGTNEKDVSKIEDKFIAKDEEEYLQFERMLRLTLER